MHGHPCASRDCHNELPQGQPSFEIFKMTMTCVHQCVRQLKKIPIVSVFAFVDHSENDMPFVVDLMDKN